MKRTELHLFTILFCISIYTFGQTVDQSEIIGKWNVVNLQGGDKIADSEKENMEPLLKAFRESTFEFKSDNNFTLDIDFIGIEDMMIEVHWRYIKDKSIILINEWKDMEKMEGELMEIEVERKNGKIFFKLTESPLILEVVR